MAATSQFEIPSLASPPDTSSITTTRTPLKTHVTHLRARAVWARSIATQSEEIKTRIDTVNSEIVVLQTAAKIALVTDGIDGGKAGSPRPVGELFVRRKCTSISGGAWRMRVG